MICSGHKHPAPPMNCRDPIFAEPSTKTRDDGVAPSIAQLSEPSRASDLHSREDTARMTREHVVDGALASAQACELVLSIRNHRTRGIHAEGLNRIPVSEPSRMHKRR